MSTKKKRYTLVFAGIFLIALGGLIYYFSPLKKRSAADNAYNDSQDVSILVRVKRGNNIEEFRARPIFKSGARNVRYKSQPLDFVYEVPGFEPSIPHDAGLKRHYDSSDLDGLKIVCGSKACGKQVLTTKSAKSFRDPRLVPAKVKVVKGDVMFSKDSLRYLEKNVKVLGDLYIRNIDFLKIPKNFSVMGNIYITNSEGVTFMGGNFVDGHIFVRGKSSLRALPYDVKLSGQIFI
jgi:hypothetical protein